MTELCPSLAAAHEAANAETLAWAEITEKSVDSSNTALNTSKNSRKPYVPICTHTAPEHWNRSNQAITKLSPFMSVCK